MANGALASDDMSVARERLAAIERDSKWQSLFTKLAFTAMLAVGIAYIAVTAIIIFQMSDLNVSMARLTDQVTELQIGQDELQSDIVELKDDMVAVKLRLEIE